MGNFVVYFLVNTVSIVSSLTKSKDFISALFKVDLGTKIELKKCCLYEIQETLSMISSSLPD